MSTKTSKVFTSYDVRLFLNLSLFALKVQPQLLHNTNATSCHMFFMCHNLSKGNFISISPWWVSNLCNGDICHSAWGSSHLTTEQEQVYVNNCTVNCFSVTDIYANYMYITGSYNLTLHFIIKIILFWVAKLERSLVIVSHCVYI